MATSGANSQLTDCSRFQNSSGQPSVIGISNFEAHWSAMEGNAKHELQLSLSFLSKNSGFKKIQLYAASAEIFCGIFHKPEKRKSVVNIWLSCNQNNLTLDERPKLTFSNIMRRRRRSLPQTYHIDLPGCNLLEFKKTPLCQRKSEEKIRFHARRVPNKRSIKVVLSPSVYTSKFEDAKRAQSRRYHVALVEEPPPEVWLGVGGGNMLRMKTIGYPNRAVRFRRLAPKRTYVISVWKNGEVKRYAKKVVVC